MIKVQTDIFAGKQCIKLTDTKKDFGVFNPQILRTRAEIEFLEAKYTEEINDKLQVLQALKVLKQEVRE
jgi:hypothetical protein